MTHQQKQLKQSTLSITKGILLISGMLFVSLGIIGIFIPILPTTPFLLLAAACFARSSHRFHTWLITNKLFGNYIRNYQEGKGIPKHVKIITIALLWTTILFSIVVILNALWIKILLILIAIGVSIHILTLKTKH